MPHCWKSHASRAHFFLGNILHAFLCYIAPRFHGQKASTVTDHNIDEASGLCASHEHPGILYTHNDSGGNDHRIYAIEATTGMCYTHFEACIGVLGIQDICHFTSRDIGYYPFYFQGYGILGSIFLLLQGVLKI